MNNKRIFVTGGTGLVGGHVVEKLLEKNNEVIVGIRSRDPKAYFFQKKLDQNTILTHYDLKDFQRVFDIITKYEVNIIIHLGAQPIVTTAYKNPYETISSNIMGTVNILEATRLCGNLEAIVVASSDKAYGKSEILPYVENMKLNGKHPYDCSKSCTDLIAMMYAETYNLPITVSRFGNIFGPGDLNFNRIIPGIMKALIVNEPLLLRSDGTMVRQYLYAKDVADGYVLLADNIEKTKKEAFNFGSDRSFTVMELVSLCEKVFKRKISYKILNIADGEIQEQYLDSSRLKNLLGWQCDYDVEEALRETFEWYKKYFYEIE